MATIFERLTANMEGRDNAFMLLRPDRIKLAYQVLNLFQKSRPGQRYEKKKSVEENNQLFSVNDYPEDFTPEIDALIKSYYKGLFAAAHERKQNAGVVTPAKRERVRKSIKKPVYTASAKKE